MSTQKKDTTHHKDSHGDQTGRVTGGKWMGRVIKATKDLAYGLGYGTGAAVASGQNAVEGLMLAINELSNGAVLKAQQIGAAVAKGSGVHVEALKKIDQKPFADGDAPSLAGGLANAFHQGAKDGKKAARSFKKAGGKEKPAPA